MDDLEKELVHGPPEKRTRVELRSAQDRSRLHGPFRGVKEDNAVERTPFTSRADRVTGEESPTSRGRNRGSGRRVDRPTASSAVHDVLDERDGENSRVRLGQRGAVDNGGGNESPRSASPSPWRVEERVREIQSRSRAWDSPSPENEVFPLASRSTTCQGRAKLQTFAEKHPGVLASSMLQRMQARVMDEGEAATKATTPVVGKLYYNKILKDKLVNKRNAQEAKTLLTVLDHLSSRRYNQAGDILAQRTKAIEVAQESGTWDTAKFLELVEDDGDPLMSKEEQALIQQQGRFENAGKGQSGPAWKGKGAKDDRYQWDYKGKGYQADQWGGHAAHSPATDSTGKKGKGDKKGKWW